MLTQLQAPQLSNAELAKLVAHEHLLIQQTPPRVLTLLSRRRCRCDCTMLANA